MSEGKEGGKANEELGLSPPTTLPNALPTTGSTNASPEVSRHFRLKVRQFWAGARHLHNDRGGTSGGGGALLVGGTSGGGTLSGASACGASASGGGGGVAGPASSASCSACFSPVYSRVFMILGIVDGEELESALAASGASSAPLGAVFLRVLDCTSCGALDAPLPSDVTVKFLSVKAVVPTSRRGFQEASGAAEAAQLGARVKEYLKAQLIANPLARHLIVVFRKDGLGMLRLRGGVRGVRRGSLLGTGQYMALANCNSQINGLTPLEVRDVGTVQSANPQASEVEHLNSTTEQRIPAVSSLSNGISGSHLKRTWKTYGTSSQGSPLLKEEETTPRGGGGSATAEDFLCKRNHQPQQQLSEQTSLKHSHSLSKFNSQCITSASP